MTRNRWLPPSASPRLPDFPIGYFENVDSIHGFWSVETRRGHLVCVEGCPWRRVLFRETDLFRGCLTLKWYAPGIQKGVDPGGSRDKGEREGGDARRGTCLLVRRKEESWASTCIFHSFAILSMRREEYVVWREIEGGKKKEKERGSGREARWKWTFVIDDDVVLLFSPSQYECSLPFVYRPASRRNSRPGSSNPCPPALTFVRHFSSGTLARQSYSPFRHYVHPASVPFLQSGRVI